MNFPFFILLGFALRHFLVCVQRKFWTAFIDNFQTLTGLLFPLISFTTFLPSGGARYQVPVENKYKPYLFIYFFNPQILFPISTVELCLRCFLGDTPCGEWWCSRYDEIRLAVSPFRVLCWLRSLPVYANKTHHTATGSGWVQERIDVCKLELINNGDLRIF
jgi:hypothetical protein